ncbi:MAG TPA: hypothetical protein VGG39_11705 [Polyangiaceae bacterium]|jgi:hypothetical protein
MNRRLVVIGTVVLACGVGIAVFGSVRRRAPVQPAATSTHGNGIDHAMSAVLALYSAPTGKTPCESAFNAFKASEDYAAKEHVTAVVISLTPHDDFIARCTAQPPLTQQCIVPLYLSQHRDECAKVKPSQQVLDSLAILKHPTEPGESNPDEPPPGQEPPPVPVGSR